MNMKSVTRNCNITPSALPLSRLARDTSTDFESVFTKNLSLSIAVFLKQVANG